MRVDGKSIGGNIATVFKRLKFLNFKGAWQQVRPPGNSRVEMLKALAHPVRLGLVDALAFRRLRAGDLAGLFPVDRTTISKHIAILREAGILENEREGRNIYYSLRDSCLNDLLN